MINKIVKGLKNKQNYGKINYKGFKTEFEKEADETYKLYTSNVITR